MSLKVFVAKILSGWKKKRTADQDVIVYDMFPRPSFHLVKKTFQGILPQIISYCKNQGITLGNFTWDILIIYQNKTKKIKRIPLASLMVRIFRKIKWIWE